MLHIGEKLLDIVGGNPLDGLWLKTSLCIGREPFYSRSGEEPQEPRYSPAVSEPLNEQQRGIRRLGSSRRRGDEDTVSWSYVNCFSNIPKGVLSCHLQVDTPEK